MQILSGACSRAGRLFWRLASSGKLMLAEGRGRGCSAAHSSRGATNGRHRAYRAVGVEQVMAGPRETRGLAMRTVQRRETAWGWTVQGAAVWWNSMVLRRCLVVTRLMRVEVQSTRGERAARAAVTRLVRAEGRTNAARRSPITGGTKGEREAAWVRAGGEEVGARTVRLQRVWQNGGNELAAVARMAHRRGCCVGGCGVWMFRR